VAVLLDAPRPEFVPRGLALAVGEKYAVRILRVIARRTLESIVALGWEPVVWFAPAEALPEMRRWLGDAIALFPRASGALGNTLATIAEQSGDDGCWLACRPAGAGLTIELLARARQAIDEGGLVFGATTREDVYLLGGPAAFGDFIRELPWDEPELATIIRTRLRDLGAGWAELPRLVEVSNEDDLRAAGLLT
jgi:glycosyltransferase A (GT-A) superfamily protein (DUF2064 family)